MDWLMPILFSAMVILAIWIERRTSLLIDLIARNVRVNAAFMEALALTRYGAIDEAIELLERTHEETAA